MAELGGISIPIKVTGMKRLAKQVELLRTEMREAMTSAADQTAALKASLDNISGDLDSLNAAAVAAQAAQEAANAANAEAQAALQAALDAALALADPAAQAAAIQAAVDAANAASTAAAQAVSDALQPVVDQAAALAARTPDAVEVPPGEVEV